MRVRAGLWVFAFVMLCPAGVGCRRAGQVVEDRFVAPERFEARAPDAGLWRLRTNRRTSRRTEVEFRRRGGGGLMRVRTRPLEPVLAALPLDVLAQQVVLQETLLDGWMLELETMSRIVLDEREAIAFTGARYDRPRRWPMSSIVLRSQGYLLTVTFAARPELFMSLSSEFERLLRHFKIMLPGPFDPYVLEDLPMGAPGPSPGNARPQRKPVAPPLVKPSTGAPPF